ncbi:MAG: adenylate/guanylate cyclase domain-containing protein [Terricaulis sp.]
MPVGYLFTDIEGSVERWEASPKRMADAVARHDTIVDACVAESGGVIKDRAGDGVFAIFPEAGNPIACAVAIQIAIANEDWSAVNDLRLRIGVHATNAAGPSLIDRTAVNRASRIMETGAGGQTVVSETATQAYTLPLDAELVDLGVRYLKGIPEALRLFGLRHPRIPHQDFPTLSSQFRSFGAIPLHTTPLFGRAHDAEKVSDVLEQTRLATIVGPGGNGKTRLSIEVGQQWERREPVLFLSLRGVNGSAELVDALGEALRFPFRDQAAHDEQLCEYLKDKRLLLILDNADGVAGDAGFVSKLLSSCPEIAVLATAREPLFVSGEGLYRLGGISAEGGVETNPACQIFLHAARAHAPSYDIKPSQMPTFEVLCRRVGGSPLALRLMAQWARFLSIEEMLSQLGSGLDFLSTASAEEEHHRTLRDVFEESWRRLNERQREALSALAVFEGAFDWRLAAALEISLDVFVALEQKCLIEPTIDRHFQLHPIIGGYAREKLAADPVAERAALAAHRRYFLGFVQDQMSGLRDHGQSKSIDALVAALVDIRAAWADGLQCGDHAGIEATIEPLCYFLAVGALLREGAASFGEAAKIARDPAIAAHCKAVCAAFLVQQGGISESIALANEVLRDADARPLAIAHAHMALAGAAHSRGDFDSALSNYEATIALRRSQDDRIGLIFACLSLGALHLWRGDAESAREPIREGYVISGDCGLVFGLIVSRMFSGDIAVLENRREDARTNFLEGLELERSARNPQYRAQLLRRAGSLARRMNKSEEAEQHHAEALELLLDLGEPRGQAQAYIDLGDDSLARESFGAARDHFLRGGRLARGIASAHLLDCALLGCAQAELGFENVALAHRILRFLYESGAILNDPVFVALMAAHRTEVAMAPSSCIDELLDELTRLDNARALKH